MKLSRLIQCEPESQSSGQKDKKYQHNSLSEGFYPTGAASTAKPEIFGSGDFRAAKFDGNDYPVASPQASAKTLDNRSDYY